MQKQTGKMQLLEISGQLIINLFQGSTPRHHRTIAMSTRKRNASSIKFWISIVRYSFCQLRKPSDRYGSILSNLFSCHLFRFHFEV